MWELVRWLRHNFGQSTRKWNFYLLTLPKRYCSTTFFRVAKSSAKQEYDMNKHINLVSLSCRIIFKFIRKTWWTHMTITIRLLLTSFLFICRHKPPNEVKRVPLDPLAYCLEDTIIYWSFQYRSPQTNRETKPIVVFSIEGVDYIHKPSRWIKPSCEKLQLQN